MILLFLQIPNNSIRNTSVLNMTLVVAYLMGTVYTEIQYTVLSYWLNGFLLLGT